MQVSAGPDRHTCAIRADGRIHTFAVLYCMCSHWVNDVPPSPFTLQVALTAGVTVAWGSVMRQRASLCRSRVGSTLRVPWTKRPPACM